MIVAIIRNSARNSSRFMKNTRSYADAFITKRDSVPFSRFPVPQTNELPADIKEKFDTVLEKSGFIPNVFKVLAHRPDEFRAFFSYYESLMDSNRGSLTKAEKELIVVATSSSNNCLYCVIAHGAIHRIYSKNPYVADQVATNWQSANLTPREKAIIQFSLDIAHMKHIKDEQIQELKQYGLDSEDVWDIGAITALFALSNRMAHLTNMKPNEEFYSLGRIPKSKKL